MGKNRTHTIYLLFLCLSITVAGASLTGCSTKKLKNALAKIFKSWKDTPGAIRPGDAGAGATASPGNYCSIVEGEIAYGVSGEALPEGTSSVPNFFRWDVAGQVTSNCADTSAPADGTCDESAVHFTWVLGGSDAAATTDDTFKQCSLYSTPGTMSRFTCERTQSVTGTLHERFAISADGTTMVTVDVSTPTEGKCKTSLLTDDGSSSTEIVLNAAANTHCANPMFTGMTTGVQTLVYSFTADLTGASPANKIQIYKKALPSGTPVPITTNAFDCTLQDVTQSGSGGVCLTATDNVYWWDAGTGTTTSLTGSITDACVRGVITGDTLTGTPVLSLLFACGGDIYGCTSTEAALPGGCTPVLTVDNGLINTLSGNATVTAKASPAGTRTPFAGATEASTSTILGSASVVSFNTGTAGLNTKTAMLTHWKATSGTITGFSDLAVTAIGYDLGETDTSDCIRTTQGTLLCAFVLSADPRRLHVLNYGDSAVIAATALEVKVPTTKFVHAQLESADAAGEPLQVIVMNSARAVYKCPLTFDAAGSITPNEVDTCQLMGSVAANNNTFIAVRAAGLTDGWHIYAGDGSGKVEFDTVICSGTSSCTMHAADNLVFDTSSLTAVLDVQGVSTEVIGGVTDTRAWFIQDGAALWVARQQTNTAAEQTQFDLDTISGMEVTEDSSYEVLSTNNSTGSEQFTVSVAVTGTKTGVKKTIVENVYTGLSGGTTPFQVRPGVNDLEETCDDCDVVRMHYTDLEIGDLGYPCTPAP